MQAPFKLPATMQQQAGALGFTIFSADGGIVAALAGAKQSEADFILHAINSASQAEAPAPVPQRDPPTRPLCNHCGSADVWFDATADWDEVAGRYTLGATFDNGGCSQCDGEMRRAHWHRMTIPSREEAQEARELLIGEGFEVTEDAGRVIVQKPGHDHHQGEEVATLQGFYDQFPEAFHGLGV